MVNSVVFQGYIYTFWDRLRFSESCIWINFPVGNSLRLGNRLREHVNILLGGHLAHPRKSEYVEI